MIGAKIHQALTAAGKLEWYTTGRKLNPYQKEILKKHNLSTSKYTAILFSDRDQPFSFIVKLCKALDINISDLA